MNHKEMYPLLFRPNLKTLVWGGHRLQPYKGLKLTDEPIGESWEVSSVPGSESIISNGEYEGLSIDKLIERFGSAILGEKVARQYGHQLPLLMKLIDADRDLSIQVHPNDEMARRVHGKMGKSEMWYVIDAKPGSYLYAGFKQPISSYEYQKRVEDGSITEVLARHEVHSGDVFYLPAGRVHAICGGILLAEVQQSSDVTYRIYDYHRLGMDGKPRELHTELAAQALDYEVLDDYRTQYSESKNKANSVLSCPYFSVRVTEIPAAMNGETSSFHRNLLKYDSFIISTCLEGCCKIKSRVNGSEITLRAGNSTLIPASIADFDVIPMSENFDHPAESVRLLDAFIDNKDNSLSSIVTRFLHITNK